MLKTVLDSISSDDPTFKGDGYISLAVIYGVFSLCNWLAPSALSITGPRGAMLIGAVTNCLFILSFLWPKTWLLYFASCILGAGAALTWTGQGTFLSKCSSPVTISRNSGIFWAMLQASMFFGNLFVYYQFQGKTHIDENTRQLVFSVLIAVAILGVIFLATLKSPQAIAAASAVDTDAELDENLPIKSMSENVVTEFRSALNLFLTKDMLLLSVAFLYTGLELSFSSGVYSPSIGFTLSLGDVAKQLVGLSGICIGLGEVFRGLLFGTLGTRTTRFGRDPIVIVGFVVHVISFFLIFLNLPDESPAGDTNEMSFFDPPKAWIALICSFLLGLGDSCFNTQIYSMLGGVFAKNSAAAFAIFKFTQSIAAAASFVYSLHLGLRAQMGILVVFGTLGTAYLCLVEWATRRRQT